MLMAVGLLISGNAGAQETPTWPQTFESDETAVDAGAVAKIGSDYYATLNSAFVAAPASTETTVTLLTDISPVIKSGNYSVVVKNQNIILELNGHVIDLAIQECKSSAVISNSGTLTIQDNSDKLSDFESPFTQEVIKQYRGSGSGKISCFAQNPDMQPVPGVATNTITNTGTLTVKSGTIDNRSVGTASYAIDNQGAGKVYISGGKISSNQSNSIRMFCPNNQSIEITGGEIYRIWVQDDNSASKVASLSITNATLTQGLLVGYYDVIENFTLTMDNCIVGDYILYELPAVETNTLTINNCKSGALYMINPRAVLTNGLYRFEGEVGLGWCYVDESEEYKPWYGEEAWKAKGVRIGEQYPDDSRYINYYQGYLSPEALLHNFYDYIVSGYGLVARPDVGPNWYEVAQQSQGGAYDDKSKIEEGTSEYTTKIDPNGGTDDANLANYWHKTQTWESEEIPVSGDPVVIDHNVIVEAGSKADAASVVIESGQKLIVQEGATLHIEDAGALFKDGTAQMIVESGAVVTVGANGVIADNTDNIIIKSTETENGIFMMNPGVTINTQPKARVELFTKSKQINNNPYEYIWQRFAIPTKDGEATVYTDNHTTETPLFNGETSYVDAVFGWSNDKQDWYMLSRWKDMVPFNGYQLTNNTAKGDITYYFEGDLVGNHDGIYQFAVEGFHFFGNSYTAPIYIASFLQSIADENNGVQRSLWIYDVKADNFVPVTQLQAEYGTAKYADGTAITEIRSMQAFIMNTNSPDAVSTVDYTEAIWGNPRYQPGTSKAPARATVDFDMATIRVNAENGQADQITLIQSNEFSAEYEDGADAAKYTYAEGINIYANTACGQLANVATNDLDGTILAFKSGKATQYTLSFDNLNGDIFTLVDLETSTQIEMKAGSEYSFTQTENTNNEARFVVMGGNKAPTGNAQIQSIKVNKVIENGHFYIIKNGTRYNAVGLEF